MIVINTGLVVINKALIVINKGWIVIKWLIVINDSQGDIWNIDG